MTVRLANRVVRFFLRRPGCTCIGCARWLPSWRFALKDTRGWWHPWCFIKGEVS